MIEMRQENIIVVELNQIGYEYDIHSLIKAFYPMSDIKVFVSGEKQIQSTEGNPSFKLFFLENIIDFQLFNNEVLDEDFCHKISYDILAPRAEIKNKLKQDCI